MAATRRLQKELQELRESNLKSFRNIVVDEQNILSWQGLIVPENPPYNKGAFKIEINYPGKAGFYFSRVINDFMIINKIITIFQAEYPFKPPKIAFKTKIYHPNIDEKGQVCLPIINADNWKPATKTDQVIQSLIALVNDPEPEHPLRGDLAEGILLF